MEEILRTLQSPLFAEMSYEDRKSALGCIGYHISTFSKGAVIAFEEENIRHVGIVISGAVDMIKEDIWGNKTLVVRTCQNEMFGETFACGTDNLSVVTFIASKAAKILFIPFDRTMRNCKMACSFHQKLMENMVQVIAGKNRDLLRKVEVVSKRTIREKILTYLSIQSQTIESSCFEIPLRRIELAEYLCVDRSALTRELVKMRDEGLIDYDKNRFCMKNH